MPRDEGELEARLRALLRDEAGEIWPPPTLWPRVQAHLTRPIAGASPLPRPRAELCALLRRSDMRRLTLALLAEREMDAFTLARRVEDIARGGGYPVPREGTLLPLLHRLEIEGLLDTRWRPGPQGVRRSYALSVRGRRVLRWVWLTWRMVDLRARLGRLVPHHVPMAR